MLPLNEQIALKIKLENAFKPDIRRVFNSMLQDFRLTVSRTGLTSDPMSYVPVWTAALDKQYRRVQKTFIGGIGFRKSYKQDEDDEIDEELLLLALMMYRQENIPPQTAFITATNTNEMRGAIRSARQEALFDGVTLTNQELALAATAILRRKFKSRVNTIAMQETETVAEATKFIEAEVASDLTPGILGGAIVATQTEKIWRNMGDSAVRRPPKSRFDHWTAGGQKVNLLEPFIVSGEQLMYPKDTSRGASYGNVVKCRCLSEYVL